MVKEKKIIRYTLGYLTVGIIICLIGISNVFAASYNVNSFTAQLYDNLGPTLNEKSTSKETDFYYGFTGLTAYSSGGAWGISSPIPLLANHTYSMTVDPFAPGCGFTILSSYPRLGVGTNLANAKTSYQNNTNVNEKFYQAVSNSRYLQYVFTPSINASYIVFPFATTSSCTNNEVQLSTVVIEDLGESGVSQDQINTSLNNQTNEINNSIQNSTDTITGEINDMENAIIENQQVCSYIDKSNIEIDGQVLYVNGNTGTLSSMGITSYIKIDDKSKLTITATTLDAVGLCFYNINKELISCVAENSYSLNDVITIPENTSYFRATIRKATNVPTFKMCVNGNQATNDKLNDLNSSLNDSNVDGSLGDAESFFDNFSTSDHGGLSGIITAPLTAINQMLNTSCSPMTTTFKGKELSLPCGYEFWNKMGLIQDFVNLVLGGLLCYQIIIKLYKLIEKIKNPEDDRLEVMDL